MKRLTSFILLTFVIGFVTGCTTDPEKAAQKADKKVQQAQQKVDRIDQTLNK